MSFQLRPLTLLLLACAIPANAALPAAAQVSAGSNPLRSTTSASDEPAAVAPRRDDKVRPAAAVSVQGRRRSSSGRNGVRNAAHEYLARRHVPGGYVPRHEEPMAENFQPELAPGEILVDGDPNPVLEPEPMVGDDCCGVGHAGHHCCLLPCPILSWENVQASVGVHGFTGPANRGGAGSFGFHEGLNWGAPLPCLPGNLGIQLGVEQVHSNFSGADFTDDKRHQTFVTAGLFRRVDWGLQGGVVVDYLHDQWYASTDVLQLRGELSWVYPCRHELGFWFAANIDNDTTVSTLINDVGQVQRISETWEPTDLYAFFYRLRFDESGANGRLFAGFTGQSDGLVGADATLPLSDHLALVSEFTYLVPEEGAESNGHVEEGWNVGISVVWYPGCTGVRGDYFRPLFNVADNGTFFVDRE